MMPPLRPGDTFFSKHYFSKTVDGRNPAHYGGIYKNLVDDGDKHPQPQLVREGFLKFQGVWSNPGDFPQALPSTSLVVEPSRPPLGALLKGQGRFGYTQ